jgi:hypothetical protein
MHPHREEWRVIDVDTECLVDGEERKTLPALGLKP